MRRPLIAGNWKMNATRKQASELLQNIKVRTSYADPVEWVVFPPFVYLELTERELAYSPVKWGAQNASPFGHGAYTGEVSLHMLHDFGCQYVILGHSERRQLFREHDHEIADKVSAAVSMGMTPIVCVGESYENYQQGATDTTVRSQIERIHQRLQDNYVFNHLAFAYEPVWAIGTGLSASADHAQHVHKLIRHCISELSDTEVAETVRIVYGGSVKPDNAYQLLAKPDVDGCLVGGASLDADKFIRIGKCGFQQMENTAVTD